MNKERNMASRDPDQGFWRGRRVLVTGHTGFKGSWLMWWLHNLGSELHGVSLLEPPSRPSLWDGLRLSGVTESRADVAGSGWQEHARRFSPDVVLHLAAQPLVARGYSDPSTTFATNVQGTVQVLGLLSELPAVKACLVITTDKVYDVRQSGPFTEADYLGGKDPYSASKAAAELVVASWPTRVPLATARAGNVIGGGDWAMERLLPDLVRAWSRGAELTLRMPYAVRPWQHVVEPLAGYLMYVEDLVLRSAVPSALNFGPQPAQAATVEEVVEYAASEWARLVPKSRPAWRVVNQPGMKEAEVLALDSTSALETLGWHGRWDWQEAVTRSLAWYIEVDRGVALGDLVAADIEGYLGGRQRCARCRAVT